ncbi:MAG: ABATE domain-containing protein [Acidobacteria bacterium]|nr:ABATE domain-containing protein [Acidobacteriota bacterium]MBV9476117.1 ABATE domain-containing protein [Acidobacteriota bacterium]
MKPKRHFSFIGGATAIDFVNTEGLRDGKPIDLLDGPEALEEWLIAADLLAPRDVRGRLDARTLDAVRTLRAALRRIVTAMSEDKPPRRQDVGAIDAELARAPGALALTLADGKLAASFQPRGDAAKDARFVLARMAATFLAEANPQRLHLCGGARCIRFFYDTSKSGTRRWCTMSGCGNREKSAKHRAARRA